MLAATLGFPVFRAQQQWQQPRFQGRQPWQQQQQQQQQRHHHHQPWRQQNQQSWQQQQQQPWQQQATGVQQPWQQPTVSVHQSGFGAPVFRAAPAREFRHEIRHDARAGFRSEGWRRPEGWRANQYAAGQYPAADVTTSNCSYALTFADGSTQNVTAACPMAGMPSAAQATITPL